MLHHVSITAEDPLHVAEVLAGLIGGRVVPFAPWPGGYIAIAHDGAGTAVEVYPRGTELSPDPAGQARFQHSYFAATHTGTHIALSVRVSEQEVRTAAAQWGWQVQRLDRGGFDVLEMWIENRVMVELLTPAMLSRYLAVVGAPRIGGAGDEVGELAFTVQVPAAADAVWRTWTDPAALVAWWGLTGARVDLRVGGAYELFFLPEDAPGDRGTENCRILSYVPGRMLSFSWAAPARLGMGREHTWVVVQLAAASHGTEVRLHHCGFGAEPQWHECREYFRKAWRRVLHRFAAQWPTVPGPTASAQAAPGSPAPGLTATVVPEQRLPDTIDLRDGDLRDGIVREDAVQPAKRRPSVR